LTQETAHQQENKSMGTENLFLYHKNGTKSRVIYRSGTCPSDWNKGLRKSHKSSTPMNIDVGTHSSFVIFKNSDSSKGQMAVVSNNKLRVKKNA